MSNPKNPLDVFVTYTYHFELHAAPSWDTLKVLSGENDANLSTTRYSPNGTLLINTRKDAHQTIDNVKFTAWAAFTDSKANMSADGDLTLDVEEPGGMSFVGKLEKLKAIYNIKSFSTDLVFGLKIMFVGRDINNNIKTVHMPSIIPLQFIDSSGSFTHAGGRYSMFFVISSYLLNINKDRRPNNLAPNAITLMNRNISISAKTCEEALKVLETNLNTHYDMVFDKEIDLTGGRKIKYIIDADKDIKGKLKIVNTDSYAEGENVKINFDPNIDASSMIRKILFCTDEVSQLIADSQKGAKIAFHPGVKIPFVTPHYVLRDNVVEVRIEVGFYKGENNSRYMFDFYFSKPGKNVDVLAMDIKFPTLTSWLELKTTQSTSLLSNTTSRTGLDYPKVFSQDVVYPDALSRRLAAQVQEKATISVPANSVVTIGASTNNNFSMVSVMPDHIPLNRLAFASMSAIFGCTEPQLNVQIRGHLDLLQDCNVFPDGQAINGRKVEAFGSTRGVWLKIDIFDQDGTPFYYTGWYQLMGIENTFSGGKFTQNLTIMMMEADEQPQQAETVQASFRRSELGVVSESSQSRFRQSEIRDQR